MTCSHGTQVSRWKAGSLAHTYHAVCLDVVQLAELTVPEAFPDLARK
jgi:hypothetical protein